MSDKKIIEFKVLSVPQHDLIGSSTSLKAAPFQAPNAAGDVRQVQNYDEVRELGSAAAGRLIAAFSTGK